MPIYAEINEVRFEGVENPVMPDTLRALRDLIESLPEERRCDVRIVDDSSTLCYIERWRFEEIEPLAVWARGAFPRLWAEGATRESGIFLDCDIFEDDDEWVEGADED